MNTNSLFENLTPLLLSNSSCSMPDNVNWLMLSNGAADLNDNVIFYGFEGKCAEPSFVAKVPRLPNNARVIKTEYECLTELFSRMGVDAVKYLPEPLAFFEAGKQSVLVISYVRGEGLLYSAKKKLWHDPERVLVLSQEVAISLRRLHDKISERLTDNEKISLDFHRKIESFVDIYKPVSYERNALLMLADRYSAQITNCKTMIQGDFWHGNIIRSSEFNSLVFIDWQYAHWSTDVSLDVYLFLLAGAVAISQGSDKERARSTIDTLRQWQSKVIPAYLAAYGEVKGFSLLPVKYGMMLCCVEKAVRPTLVFGCKQSDDLIWRNLFTELVNISDDGFLNGI